MHFVRRAAELQVQRGSHHKVVDALRATSPAASQNCPLWGHLLTNTFNLRCHVRYETNTIARPLAAQQPHFLIGS